MTIAVYGASGFTGKLVLAELHRRNITAVAVGRNADRLRDTGWDYRVAELDALDQAFDGCDVVINCVAPFVRHGEPVVRAAIAAGAHYLDIAGEQRYIKRIFDTFGESAEQAGVTVVPMVNDGGFLADLLASVTADKLGEVDELVVAHRFGGNGGLSRGSGRTALANLEMFRDGGLSYSGGAWLSGEPGRTTSILFPGDTEPVAVVKFALPEIATLPRHIQAEYVEAVATAELSASFAAVTPELVESLPENPTGIGTFQLVVEARGAGRTTRGTIEGSDTYGTTASVAVEAAERLLLNAAKPGVLAPAQAFDPEEFLNSQAVQWTVG